MCSILGRKQLHESAVASVVRRMTAPEGACRGVESIRTPGFESPDARSEPDNLEAAMAQPARPQPDPNEKLVKVFDSEQESEAMVVKGLLDSASIESDLALSLIHI